MDRSIRGTLVGIVGAALLVALPPAATARERQTAQTPPKTQTKAPPAAKAPAPAAADTDDREVNLRAYVELLRSDLRAQKTAIMAGVLQLSEQEDAKFWPIYREYEAELVKINDDRIANIKDYADHFDQLTDDMADKLIQRALEIQGRRGALLGTYYNKLKAALSAKTAARVIQVENQVLLILDLQIAASLPIVKGDTR
jgi:hypothetical protein